MARIKFQTQAPAALTGRGRMLLAGLLMASWLGACARPTPASSPTPASGAEPTAAGTPIAFQGGTVIDVTDGHLLPTQTVVVVDRRVTAVGPTAKVRVPNGARLVDVRGKYLIPGLWDMHFHLYTWLPRPVYKLLIANGVTGIRDPATFYPLDSLRHWRAQVAAGALVGPRQVLTGALLQPNSESPNVNGLQFSIKAGTPARAREVIDSLRRAGAEFIKTHGEGVPRETFFAMAAEGKRVGAPLEGHLEFGGAGPGIIEASDSGMRVLDHLIGVLLSSGYLAGTCDGESASLAKCTALATRLRRNGTWIEIGPTFSFVGPIVSNLPYIPDSTRPKAWPPLSEDQKHVGTVLSLMARSGAPLLSGTDVDGGPVISLPKSLIHEELAFDVQNGLTPLQALQTVTLSPALLWHATDSLGTIARGKLADLLVLDGNPLADITNTAKIRAVVANGRYFDRAALDSLLTDAVHSAGKLDYEQGP